VDHREEDKGRLRPNRLIKRATEFIQEMETTHHTNDVRAVTGEMKGKLISLQGYGRIGGSGAGMWRWFLAFIQARRYTGDVLQMGADWISDE
jgi:hypothetical protein